VRKGLFLLDNGFKMNNSGIYNNADRMKNWYCINNFFEEGILMILTKTPGGNYDEHDYWTVSYIDIRPDNPAD
jgi:hypothetical protein